MIAKFQMKKSKIQINYKYQTLKIFINQDIFKLLINELP